MENDAKSLLATASSRVSLRRVLAWGIGIVLAIAAIGFLALPPLLKPMLEDRLSTELSRKVAIGGLKLNPFALTATLSDVSIAERGEGPPLLTFSELFVNASSLSLPRWAPVIREVKLTRPALHVVRNADKSYNISDLIDRAMASPPGPPPRFSVANIEVIDGRIEFDDRPERQKHEITQLAISIPFLSSLPTQTEISVVPALSAVVNGRPVVVTGETRPFKDTHETVLHWNIAALSLPRYLDYVPVALPFQLASGNLDAGLDLTFIGQGSDPAQLTLAGSARLAELVVNERSGRALLRMSSLAVALDRLEILGGSATVRQVVVDGAQLDARREKDGSVNLSTLAPRETAPDTVRKPFSFNVGRIAVRNATVRIVDDAVSPALVATLSELNAGITNLGNKADQKAAVNVSFATDAGARVAHRGTLGLNPLFADGHLDINGFLLQRLFPYYASALNLAVDEGTLDLTTDWQLAGAEPSLALTRLDATLRNLKMRLPEEKNLLWRVPVLAVHGGSVDFGKRAVAFDLVDGRGAVADVRRNADGQINFARLVRTAPGNAGAMDDGANWRVQASKVAFDDFAANFTDEATTPPAHFSLTRVSFAGENQSNVAKANSRATLKATVNKRGALTLSGTIARAPFAARLNVAAKDIDLVPFQPYITRAASVVLTAGSASARGTVDVATGTTTRVGYKGDIILADIAALDEANATDLLKWKTLSLAKIDAQLEPLAVSVDGIAVDEFFARLILNQNGEFNLQQLGRARAPTPSAAPAASPGTAELATPPGTATTWLKLGKATMAGGNVYFTDHYVRPNYSANLTQVTGSLSSLAFDQPADLEIRAKVQDSAPVEITGRINPLASNLFLDLRASASEVELPPMSPYSGKYAGYGIQKGKLSMKLHYLIEGRKLTAENGIVLDQLTFGDKVESPDATKLPVKLAVALLKDRNGVIKFDLPVGGSLDDPQFSVGGIVFRALLGLVAKIVTAPFALLGAIGGHGEELAYIEFAPGSAALDAIGNAKIDSIAKALADRPQLKLDITGRTDPAADKEGLRRAEVDHKVRVQKFNDLVKAGVPPASADVVAVTASEYEALLTRAYRASDFPKPRNAIGLPKDLPREEMETLLLTNAAVSDEDVRQLAGRRAQAVRDRLVGPAQVPADRVFLVAPRGDAERVEPAAKDKGKASRVDFALR
ncbi:MAG TPA: DUF748 domain-containing protein [Casimicrobiaceae bacterium]|nr:DUF748 domain-containing protein [Casimicrobiaceae bacterium]